MYSAAFSIILLIFGAALILYNTKLAYDRNLAYYSRMVESNLLLIERYFDQLRTIAKVVAEDRAVINAVTYRNSASVIDYSKELHNRRSVNDKIQQLKSLSIITNALIIGSDHRALYYYRASPVRDFDFASCEWFTSAQFSNDRSTKFSIRHEKGYLLNHNNKEAVSIIVPIRNIDLYTDNEIGWLMCDFELESVMSKSIRENNVHTAIYDGADQIYDPGGHLLSEGQKQIFENQLTELAGDLRADFQIPAQTPEDVNYFVLTQISDISGWRIIGIIMMDDDRKPIVIFTAALIFAALLTSVILAAILSKSFLLPLHQLVEKYREIGKGNFQVRFTKTGTSELDELAFTSQQMVESISRLNADIIEEQQKLAKEEIKALQHQINPHFLNNALHSIKALAVCEDMEAISTMATLLGKMLSYSVYNPYEMVELQKELLYVHNYVMIQNIRYDGLISYEMDCSREYGLIEVPKLMVQPIVENAFEHGFRSHQPLTVTASVFAENRVLKIRITNDGIGMERADIDVLNEKLAKNESPGDSKSVGLLNVNRRIKDIYGIDFGLQIEKPDKGLAVTIRLPWKGTTHDQSNTGG